MAKSKRTKWHKWSTTH